MTALKYFEYFKNFGIFLYYDIIKASGFYGYVIIGPYKWEVKK